jgi:hypothetical protein
MPYFWIVIFVYKYAFKRGSFYSLLSIFKLYKTSCWLINTFRVQYGSFSISFGFVCVLLLMFFELPDLILADAVYGVPRSRSRQRRCLPSPRLLLLLSSPCESRESGVALHSESWLCPVMRNFIYLALSSPQYAGDCLNHASLGARLCPDIGSDHKGHCLWAGPKSH